MNKGTTMKSKLAIVVVALLFLGACTQRTCPTYAKEDVQKDKTEKTVNA